MKRIQFDAAVIVIISILKKETSQTLDFGIAIRRHKTFVFNGEHRTGKRGC
jgi:hypothetical protein